MVQIIRMMNDIPARWIERAITARLKQALAQFPVVVVTGARQVGKTSLCRRVWPDAAYATLDIPLLAETARLDPNRFFQNHPAPVILDEIQYAPGLLRHLKVQVDKHRRPGMYLVTGSQDFLLMHGVVESLAGRCAVLTLPALSLAEVTAAGCLRAEKSDDFFWRGGYPELWQRPELDRELWLGSYLTTYLERDVRNILHVDSLRDFDRFLRAAAARAGQLLSLSELARDVGVAPNTIKKWVSLLQASHQVMLLEPWHRNVGKRLIKTPKLYFTDPGLLLYLQGFRSWPDVLHHAQWGAVWENIVVAELRKTLANLGERRPFYFWRTAAGEEVDIVIEAGGGRFQCAECKAGESARERDTKGLHALAQEHGSRAVIAARCVCRCAAPYPLDGAGRLAATPLLPWLDEVRATLGGRTG
jgi:predicted AAA+ superfamily ATPase